MTRPSANPPRVFSLVWSLIRGGTEGQCARVAMGLAARGWTHRVGVFRPEGFFLPQVEQACGPVHHLDIRGRFHPSTLWQVLRLSRFLRRERFDLLHAWDMDACLFGAPAARLAGVPFLTSRRDLGQIYPAWKLRGLAWTERKARRVVVNAEAISAVACRAGVPQARIRTLPNLLDVEEFDRLAAQPPPLPPPPAGRLRVVMVARLDPEKDAGLLARAALRLLATRKDFEVVIAGDGPERASLQALAAQTPGHYHLPGNLDDIPSLLRTCAVGVLTPRSNEGLSNTLLEYMAAGLPMIATECGGNADLVVPGRTGFLIRPGDEAGLASALARLLDDPVLRRSCGDEARRRLATRHDRGPVLDAFEALYREAADAHA